VHRLAMHPARPDVLFMQKHWDVMRSDNGGGSWREVSGNLPTDFGFPIDVHAHEPDTLHRPAERTLKVLLRTPAAARANMTGSARPGVFAFRAGPEETGMSITAWTVPGRAAGCQPGRANR